MRFRHVAAAIAATSCLMLSTAHAALVTYSYEGPVYDFLNPATDNPYAGLHLSVSITHEELGPSFSASIKDTYVDLYVNDGVRTAVIVEPGGPYAIDEFWINTLTLVTDAGGEISNWYISLSTDGLNSSISSLISGDSIRLPGWAVDCPTITGPCYAGVDFGGTGEPAVPQWTMTSTATVPIPAGAWLFGSALGLLGWLKRRR